MKNSHGLFKTRHETNVPTYAKPINFRPSPKNEPPSWIQLHMDIKVKKMNISKHTSPATRAVGNQGAHA